MMLNNLLNTRRLGLLAAGFAVFALVFGGASDASAGTPFSKLKGGWKCERGGCWVRPVGGARERVGCRVNYKVSSGGTRLSQAIRCRGSIRMTANANVRLKGKSRVSGSWSSRNSHSGGTSGGAYGRASSNKLYVSIKATDGSKGAMRARVSGRRHTVTLYQSKNGKRHVVGRLSLRR